MKSLQVHAQSLAKNMLNILKLNIITPETLMLRNLRNLSNYFVEVVQSGKVNIIYIYTNISYGHSGILNCVF